MALLQALNWGICAFFATAAVSWAAVCLMMVPYPRLVMTSEIDMATVYILTATSFGLAAVAGAAAWLLLRRHAWRWAGQLALLSAIGGALRWVWPEL